MFAPVYALQGMQPQSGRVQISLKADMSCFSRNTRAKLPEIMTAKNKIFSVVSTTVIVLAALVTVRTGLWKNCKTYLGGKPWIRNGERIEYYPGGKPKFSQLRHNGKADGLFTRWYQNGQKHMEINFADGKREGKTQSWHTNGKKASEGQFKNGGYDGTWHFYDTNETQVAEVTCRNGAFWEGTDARYLDDVLQISTYQDGHVVSSEKRKGN